MLRNAFVFAISTLGAFCTYGQQNELRALASNLAQDIAAAGKRTIAVVDFTDLQGNPSELGRFLAEEFSVALTRTHKGFEVVERNHLKAILAEHKLAATGLIDPTTAKKLGQFTGADAVVTGSMTPFAESVRVAVKVLSTDTARIIAADDADLAKTQTIAGLLGHSMAPERSSNDRSSPAMNPPTGGSAAAPAPSSPVVMVREFQYELIECKGMANSVKCLLRITNRGQDRVLALRCQAMPYAPESTTAFDNFGNESPADSCDLANRAMGSILGGASAQLISGVPVQAQIHFPNLSASASSLSLITIRGADFTQSNGYQAMIVSFRNVPVTR